jgi:hypothetical protein
MRVLRVLAGGAGTGGMPKVLHFEPKFWKLSDSRSVAHPDACLSRDELACALLAE